MMFDNFRKRRSINKLAKALRTKAYQLNDADEVTRYGEYRWISDLSTGPYKIEYSQLIRADLITIKKDAVVVIEYVDQTKAYPMSGIGVHDVSADPDHVKQLLELIKER